MGRDCPSETAFQSRRPGVDEATSGRRHQRRLTSSPLPSRGAPQKRRTGNFPAAIPTPPRRLSRRCSPLDASSTPHVCDIGSPVRVAWVCDLVAGIHEWSVGVLCALAALAAPVRTRSTSAPIAPDPSAVLRRLARDVVQPTRIGLSPDHGGADSRVGECFPGGGERGAYGTVKWFGGDLGVSKFRGSADRLSVASGQEC